MEQKKIKQYLKEIEEQRQIEELRKLHSETTGLTKFGRITIFFSTLKIFNKLMIVFVLHEMKTGEVGLDVPGADQYGTLTRRVHDWQSVQRP
jgi:hypothetical protein